MKPTEEVGPSRPCAALRCMHASALSSFDTPLAEASDLDPSLSPQVGSTEHAELTDMRSTYMSIVGALLWIANMCAPGNLRRENFVRPKLSSRSAFEASGSRLPGQEAISEHDRSCGSGRADCAEH